jgi:hypothetical protein
MGKIPGHESIRGKRLLRLLGFRIENGCEKRSFIPRF